MLGNLKQEVTIHHLNKIIVNFKTIVGKTYAFPLLINLMCFYYTLLLKNK